MLILPRAHVQTWALKEILSRDQIPPEADELQIRAQARRQVAALREYAAAALNVYAKSVDVPIDEIADGDRQAALLAIASRAFGIRDNISRGQQPCQGVTIPAPSPPQIDADSRAWSLMRDPAT